jgi:HSP20 family protein
MYLPQIDVCERADEIVILVEMPGVSRKDVTIAWKEHILIISGQKPQQQGEEGNVRYLCVERNYGPFRREIAIGIPIDYKRARAELKNGLMKIHLPKAPPQKTVDVIPIE